MKLRAVGAKLVVGALLATGGVVAATGTAGAHSSCVAVWVDQSSGFWDVDNSVMVNNCAHGHWLTYSCGGINPWTERDWVPAYSSKRADCWMASRINSAWSEHDRRFIW